MAKTNEPTELKLEGNDPILIELPSGDRIYIGLLSVDEFGAEVCLIRKGEDPDAAERVYWEEKQADGTYEECWPA